MAGELQSPPKMSKSPSSNTMGLPDYGSQVEDKGGVIRGADKNSSARTKEEKNVNVDRFYEGTPGKNVKEFCMGLTRHGKAGLEEEYKRITAQSKKHQERYQWEEMKFNKTKNRYNDILCYDHSRVHLKYQNNKEKKGYIHANFCHGYKERKHFICTQGPLETTYVDFWQMMWHEGSVLIVSTTKLVEDGKIKCGAYWPQIEKGQKQFGHFTVTTQIIRESVDKTHTRSILLLENTQTQQSRTIYHLFYTKWPDYGTPQSGTFLKFLEIMNETQDWLAKENPLSCKKDGRTPPIVIHCSAGVGRTGTLVCLDICIRKLKETGRIDIPGTVFKVRQQRFASVQKVDQYIFLNLVMLEYLIVHNYVDIDIIDNDLVKLGRFLSIKLPQSTKVQEEAKG